MAVDMRLPPAVIAFVASSRALSALFFPPRLPLELLPLLLSGTQNRSYKTLHPPPPSSFPSSLLNTIWSFDVSIVISRSAFVSTSYRVSAFTAPAPATATTFSCSRFSFFPLLTNLF